MAEPARPECDDAAIAAAVAGTAAATAIAKFPAPDDAGTMVAAASDAVSGSKWAAILPAAAAATAAVTARLDTSVRWSFQLATNVVGN